MASNSVKVVRPHRLTENETLTSFEDWRNNLEFFLRQDKDIVKFLDATTEWKKTSESVQHRGLASPEEAVNLSQFLGVIASLSPPLLHGDIVNDCPSLSVIYHLLRSYYQFAPSESTFIQFAYIKREVVDGKLERPLHLYLRIRQFVRDNLLLSSGRIEHDGKIPTSNESLSATTERLIVLRWLEILHPALPNHVSRVFAHELQFKSLKDLQPRIVNQVDDLLLQIENKSDEIDTRYTKFSERKTRFLPNNRDSFRHPARQSSTYKKNDNYNKGWQQKSIKKCDACQSVGEPFIGHDLRSCPNVRPADRMNLIKSFNLEIESPNDGHENVQEEYLTSTIFDDIGKVDIDRVNIVSSPQFNVHLNKTSVTMILDTGATGSMICLRLCELARLKVYPTPHKAVLADGNSHLNVVGEVHTSIVMDGCLTLPISLLVVTKLKAGLIAGMDFMKENEVIIDIANRALIFPNDHRVSFNSAPGNPKVSLLRADINNIVLPGETLTLPTPVNFLEDRDIAVEPRESTCWPSPCIVTNDGGHIVITNDSEKPIKLKSNQVIGQVRSVISEDEQTVLANVTTNFSSSILKEKRTVDNTLAIQVDPDNLLTEEYKQKFQELNKTFNTVFNKNLGSYNDKSGVIRASVHLGKTKPTPHKGKVPSYCSGKAQMLQEKFDELVAQGVMSRPEEIYVEVIHTSPSFLVKKGSNDHRLVTSFVELNKFIHPLPSKMSTTQDVLRDLGRFKFIIKSDLKSAYFQIRVAKESQKWLGTNSPYKGMYVYNRAPMGLRNMAEYLEEMIARVLGDYLAEGILTKIADDLIIGANTVEELFLNWERVLNRLLENNLCISPDKTIICPKSIKIIGWVWQQGTITADVHRINPLTVCPRPTNVKQMRSFIGAFRSISICIPKYAKYLCALEDAVAGKESAEKVVWDEMLNSKFVEAQKALTSPQVITLPHPEDQLFLVSDGCNSPPSVGSTLYVKRGSKLHIAGFFSAKIKKHQLLWLACEIEALCINLTISMFSNYIRESKQTTKFFTDSQACVEAFGKLSKGGFSLSPRISSFLMNLNSHNVSISHIKGSSIPLTDFCSRNPVTCADNSCQVCTFVSQEADLDVASLTVSDIESGLAKMPFYNSGAWKEQQKQDPDLRRAFSQLSNGTPVGRKEKNLRKLRRYLQVASISSNGTLIRKIVNPYGKDYELIVIPQALALGLMSAIHIRLGHPTKSQFRKVWDRHFYALDCDKLINQCVDACSLCISLKTLPKELFKQSTTDVPDVIGKVFSADIIRREKQKIMVVMDILSSFKLTLLIPNEQHETLQQALIQLVSSYKHAGGCIIKVDSAPGFCALQVDKILQSLDIKLDFGRVKNKNHNPTIDKAIQELEHEIKCLAPSGGFLNAGLLATATANSNSRLRSNGLSSKEILMKRDNFTGKSLQFEDHQLATYKHEERLKNHKYSEISKSRGRSALPTTNFALGDLVHIKNEGTKHTAREYYIIISLNHENGEATIQKLGENCLRKKRYIVKFQDLYLASPHVTHNEYNNPDEDESYEYIDLFKNSPSTQVVESEMLTNPPLRRSQRVTRHPEWLSTDEIERT